MSKLKSYNETFDKPIVAYKCEDCNGNIVEVTAKNPKNHESTHSLDGQATVHHNTWFILKNPDKVVKNPKSNNPTAIKNRAGGMIKEFVKNDFIRKLRIPGYLDYKDVTSVFVFYGNDGKNHTKTRIIRPVVPDKRKIRKLK